MAAWIAGQLAAWPSKERMAEILRQAGLNVVVGLYSIRVKDCSSFAFQEYGGDLGEPQIEADADSVEEMMADGKRVSDALARAGIRHRFEVYRDDGELAGYLHWEWPAGEAG